ncbi:hypothetical protein CDAR_487181, partial [Caerostris darwini]
SPFIHVAFRKDQTWQRNQERRKNTSTLGEGENAEDPLEVRILSLPLYNSNPQRREGLIPSHCLVC